MAPGGGRRAARERCSRNGRGMRTAPTLLFLRISSSSLPVPPPPLLLTVKGALHPLQNRLRHLKKNSGKSPFSGQRTESFGRVRHAYHAGKRVPHATGAPAAAAARLVPVLHQRPRREHSRVKRQDERGPDHHRPPPALLLLVKALPRASEAPGGR